MQAWVATNSRWRIQTANDTLIQTFGPGNSSTDLAYTLVRVPRGDGTAEISVRAGCANIFGCFPDAIEAIKAMRLAVGVGF